MPHTDGPAYLACTSTLSLGSHTVLCLRSKPSHLATTLHSQDDPATTASAVSDETRAASVARVQKVDLLLPARSLVVLTGSLYSDWLHGIAPIKGDSIESLRDCANWDDWWAYQRETTADAPNAVDKEREVVEGGKGWERHRRISLTCRRVAGKVRNLGSMLGLSGGGKGAGQLGARVR